ncbi:Ftr1 protein [Heliocybe sulcata]|uniref:Ftr1 protein n=1 Tax=Heliocybe sulcata TaxID=5364 RepID=A0A5C3MWY4_9AGAM|nr:Ftr1 protein [Heliocybe sulcata]
MTKNLFSVPIFFILWREVLEAAIIISVLLGLVEQIVREEPRRLGGGSDRPREKEREPSPVNEKREGDAVVPELREDGDGSSGSGGSERDAASGEEVGMDAKKLVKKLRWQIFLGGLIGLLIALSIGAAFIAVWFTEAADLWSESEGLWEGIFYLIASLMIFVMGVTMLKLDRAKAKWRVKLQRAFEGKHTDKSTFAGRWALLILPLITVLREGLEAVVFVSGVSLGQSATSIPIAAITGIVCGFICGFAIYQFASRTTLRVFLVVMTNFLLLIGAGLFSKAVKSFQSNAFNDLLGKQVDDSGGDGPGSFDVRGNVWHLDCCNPNNNLDGEGWMIFGSILGWDNSATLGSVLSYVFYWLLVAAALVRMKFREGRMKLLGFESAAGRRRRVEREAREMQVPTLSQ